MKLEKLLAKQKQLEAKINEARKHQREGRIRSLTRQAERLGLLDLDAEVVAVALESAARSLHLTTAAGDERETV
jgi:hypothetical protein